MEEKVGWNNRPAAGFYPQSTFGELEQGHPGHIKLKAYFQTNIGFPFDQNLAVYNQMSITANSR